jgi:integral membrane protein (TIGR01906 family)
MSEFQKYSVTKTTKIDMNDLEKITVKMLGYLKDTETDLNMQVEIDGQKEEVFGTREKDHMVDVKELFRKGFLLRNITLSVTAISILILLKQKERRELIKGFLYASVGSLSLMLLLFILIQIDFYKYFTYFHEIFFTNDLWLLNPETDVLIQMLPLEFFTDIATKIISWFLALITLIGGISFYTIRNCHKK